MLKNNSLNIPTMRIGDFLKHLEKIDKNHTIDFSGLTFNQVKQRGDTHHQLQFLEQVYRNTEGVVVVENLEQ